MIDRPITDIEFTICGEARIFIFRPFSISNFKAR